MGHNLKMSTGNRGRAIWKSESRPSGAEEEVNGAASVWDAECPSRGGGVGLEGDPSTGLGAKPVTLYPGGSTQGWEVNRTDCRFPKDNEETPALGLLAPQSASDPQIGCQDSLDRK